MFVSSYIGRQWRDVVEQWLVPNWVYFVEKLVIETGDLAGSSSKRGLHSG
jgi:hypothetical protein